MSVKLNTKCTVDRLNRLHKALGSGWNVPWGALLGMHLGCALLGTELVLIEVFVPYFVMMI